MTQVVTIAGESVVFFDFEPNWSTPISVTQEYKTDVFSAYGGREQRRALRSTPRETHEFKVSLPRSSKRVFETLMTGWLGRLFAVAEPFRGVDTIFAASAGTTRMSLAEEPDWLFAGAHVVVRHRGTAELRTVLRVEGYEVVFAAATTHSWPAGAELRPARLGRFEAGTPVRQHTSDVTEASLSFMVEPASEGPRVLGVGQVYFDGREVLMKRPNWISSLDVNYETNWTTLDFGRGARLVDFPVSYNGRTQKAAFLNRDRQEADYLRRFFRRRRGRRGQFYAPTWSRDFNLELPLVGGASEMLVADLDVFRFLSEHPTHRRLAVFTKNGGMYPNEIVGAISPTGGWGNAYGLDYGGDGSVGSTLLFMRDPWPRDIELDEITSASWLLRSRFAADSMTLLWETDSVATTQFTIQALEDEDAIANPLTGWGMNYGNYWGGASA